MTYGFELLLMAPDYAYEIHGERQIFIAGGSHITVLLSETQAEDSLL
jgi:hypothetical protein